MKSWTVLIGLTVAAWAGAASAEPYVDYTPVKGVWHVQTVKVDPNHVDDYIVGLKKTWIPGEEIAKKRGVIDSWSIKIKLNAGDGSANVLMLEHIPNMAMMEPDRERDQAIEKEVLAIMSKEKMDAQVHDFDKYRTFMSDEYWTDITFEK